MDGKIISAPVVRDTIASGSGQISGDFTFQSATAAEKIATSTGRLFKVASSISFAELTLMVLTPLIGSKFVGPEIKVVSKPFVDKDLAIS